MRAGRKAARGRAALRRASGEMRRHRGIFRRLARAGALLGWAMGSVWAAAETEAISEGGARGNLRVVLVADEKDHGPPGNGAHDYPLWQEHWGRLLGGHVAFARGWPSEEQFRSADVIVAYCYLKWTGDRLAQMRDYLEDGGGLVLIHSATWTKPEPSAGVADLVGVGGFRLFRHGAVSLDMTLPGHPICRGLPRSVVLENDETYWPPTPICDGVTVLATSVEGKGAKGSTPEAPQPMLWCYGLGKGRVFGCVPGHFAVTFEDPRFRILLLRGIAWAAGASADRFDGLVQKQGAGVCSAEGFRAGAAAMDVTPEPGVSMNGPISKPGPVDGVHDPLHARALVMAAGGVKAAVVVVDMCLMDREVIDRAKAAIRERAGIPANRVLVSSTHSHATPRVVRIETGPADEAYRLSVAERIAGAVARADGNLAPATVAFGRFDAPDMVACRRTLCEPGSVSPNPFGETGERVASVSGKGKPIEPAGPVDPQVSVVSLRHADGAPLAVLANYSVHYAGGYEKGMVSADYFGAFARCLEDSLGGGAGHPRFVAMMSNGTSGDIGGNRVEGGPHPPWKAMEIAGTALAERARRLVQGLTYREPSELKMAERMIELGVRKPEAGRLAWADRVLAGGETQNKHRWKRIYAEEAKHLAAFPDREAIMLQVLRVGDVAIVATPCEVFAETGLAIKRESPFPQTFTIGLANGVSGYLPPPAQHALGGYETWPARSSHLEVGAEPKIRAAIRQMLGEVR